MTEAHAQFFAEFDALCGACQPMAAVLHDGAEVVYPAPAPRLDPRTMENWFAFRAYNSQTLYGFGTESEAERYADAMNTGRDVNLYAAHPLSENEARELRLGENTEAFNISDELIARSGQDD